jgi:predicted nucleic acid-binding protein
MPRRLLEFFAAEGYKLGTLTRGQVGRILDLSWHEVENFLKRHNAELHYTMEDLERDRQTSRYIQELKEEALKELDKGEREAIQLAEQLKADLIILDEKEGRAIAEHRKLPIIGIIGVLDEAARNNLLNFTDAEPRKLVEYLIKEHHRQ